MHTTQCQLSNQPKIIDADWRQSLAIKNYRHAKLCHSLSFFSPVCIKASIAHMSDFQRKSFANFASSKICLHYVIVRQIQPYNNLPFACCLCLFSLSKKCSHTAVCRMPVVYVCLYRPKTTAIQQFAACLLFISACIKASIVHMHFLS